MSDVIDLDALAPQPATVKLNDKLIEIQPPSTGDLLRMTGMASKFKDADKMEAEQIASGLEALTESIIGLVPELAGQKLSLKQLLAVVELIADMAKPEDAKALDAKGITVSADPKAPVPAE